MSNVVCFLMLPGTTLVQRHLDPGKYDIISTLCILFGYGKFQMLISFLSFAGFDKK